MISVLKLLLPRRLVALMAAAILAAAFTAALIHASQVSVRPAAADNGVIRSDGIQGTGA
jgi:hypothetical protein